MYHKAPKARIKSSLSSDWNLDNSEVQQVRIEYGSNNILESPKNRWIELAIETIKDPMIWFLFVTSILFALLRNYNQSFILLLATIPLICMDAFLHWRTAASTQSLSKSLATTALILRDGKEIKVPSLEIVPGDLIKVTPGMFFPADGLLLKSEEIQIDESALTGEAFPVHKKSISSFPDNSPAPSIEDCYWGFAGTRLLTGNALLRVVFTGKETLYGEIVQSALETTSERTPLQKSIMHLVYILIIVALVMCFILAAVRYYQGFGLIDALLSAAILAVAALPDEFPVVFTFFLGLGVYRLALKKALVRRAVSVENIGRITCICSDKTGTMTEGQFKLKECSPTKNFTETQLIYLAAMSSRMDSNDPLDIAICKEIQKTDTQALKAIYTFPFTEDRKRETSIFKKDINDFLLVSKGAPEIIISKSLLTNSDKEFWLSKASHFATLGYKVIGCAQYLSNTEIKNEIESNLQFAGLLVFSDPPRQSVADAINRCLESGIHVIMITGDHMETAKTIAREIGLGGNNPKVILAEHLNNLIETENGFSLKKIDVVARAIPSQKLSIVKLLQASGEIVAVTGDGVNDVPALKAADVGISMGERGTQSAREISDIILLDDNFSSIVNAISEGRQLFKNIKLSFLYLLLIHIPFVLSAAFVPLFGFPLLYFPIHIVWVELFIHPTAMLVFQERTAPDQKLERVKQSEKIKFFTRQDWKKIILIGIITTLFVILSYIISLQTNNSTEHARAFVLASLGFLNTAIAIHLSEFKTYLERLVIIIPIVLTLIFIQTPFIAKTIELEPLHINDWLIITLFSLFLFLLLKIKYINNKQ